MKENPNSHLTGGFASVAVFLLSAGYALSQVSAPVFTPASAHGSTQFNVAVTCATPGAVIRFTTDGADSTVDDEVIASGNYVPVSRSFTLKAKAWSVGLESAVTMETTPVSVH